MKDKIHLHWLLFRLGFKFSYWKYESWLNLILDVPLFSFPSIINEWIEEDPLLLIDIRKEIFYENYEMSEYSFLFYNNPIQYKITWCKETLNER